MTVWRINDAGHMIPWDQLEAFIEASRTFLVP